MRKGKNEAKTVAEILNRFPKLSEERAHTIDQEIKKKIAEDDSFQKVTRYVQDELKGEKISKYSFNHNCSKIAEVFLENNDRWMRQENFFCLLALIISVISMVFSYINLYANFESPFCDLFQVCLFVTALVVFLILNKTKWFFKNARFKLFIDILNRYSPGLILFGNTVFYIGLFMARIELNTNCVLAVLLIHLLMLSGILLPLYSIIKTLGKLPDKE